MCSQGKTRMSIPLVSSIPLLVATLAAADTLHVPGEYATIQAGIDAAVDGDEIQVAPGTYNEAIDFIGKAVRLYSADGPDVTMIDGDGLSASVVTCVSGEGSETILDGFTITGGTGTFRKEPRDAFYGGGMYIVGSSPTVTDCLFTENNCNSGAGMQIFDGGNPILEGCRFIDNNAVDNGGGIYAMRSCSPTLVNCSFVSNRCGHVGGGIALRQDCHPLVVNCAFIDNFAGHFGGAVRSGNTGTSPVFANCLFYGNEADVGGAYAAGTDTPGRVGHSLLVNCIFWANTAPLGPQIALNGNLPADVTVAYSDVQGGEADVHVQAGFTLVWGEGNVDENPQFVDPEGDNFRLSAGSPGIDAADTIAVPEGITTDLDGNRRFMDDPDTEDTGRGCFKVVDMGVYEFPGEGPGRRNSIPPLNLEASDGVYTDRVATIWDVSLCGDEYRVYRHTENNPKASTPITDWQGATWFDDTTAEPGRTYWYWVRARDERGESGWSEGDSGFRWEGVPLPPSNVAATDGVHLNKVQVSWESTLGTDGYRVYRHTQDDPDNSTPISDWQTETFFDDRTAVSGQIYWYWVKGCNQNGESDWSEGDSGYVRCIREPSWVCDGDVNGDGQVNPVDLGLVQAFFGNSGEQALCNYDLDCDRQINPVDSGIVQALFGRCEEPRNECP